METKQNRCVTDRWNPEILKEFFVWLQNFEMIENWTCFFPKGIEKDSDF